MNPTSNEPVFVDTNVLVYAHDASETVRQPVAQAVLADLWRNRAGALSTQVLQEFYVVATRRFDPPMSRREARDLVDVYSNWQLVQIDVPLIWLPRNSKNDTPCHSGTPSSSNPPDAPAQPDCHKRPSGRAADRRHAHRQPVCRFQGAASAN